MSLQGKLLWLGLDTGEATKIRSVVIKAPAIKLLRATPVILIPNKGPNTFIELVSMVMRFYPGTQVLVESSDNLQAKYGTGTGAAASGAVTAAGFLTAAGGMVIGIGPSPAPVSAFATVINKPIVLHNIGDGEYTGNAANNAYLRIDVAYRVHTFA